MLSHLDLGGGNTVHSAGIVALATAFRSNGLSAIVDLFVHEDGVPETQLAELIFALRRPGSQVPMRKLQVGSLLYSPKDDQAEALACLDAEECMEFFDRPLTHCIRHSNHLDKLTE
jgi:hypothetical protein